MTETPDTPRLVAAHRLPTPTGSITIRESDGTVHELPWTEHDPSPGCRFYWERFGSSMFDYLDKHPRPPMMITVPVVDGIKYELTTHPYDTDTPGVHTFRAKVVIPLPPVVEDTWFRHDHRMSERFDTEAEAMAWAESQVPE